MANNIEEQIQTIYDDVAELQEQVAELQNGVTAVNENINNLQPKALNSDTDLNTLGVGTYYIPDITVSATILNKPVTSTSNASIIVMYGATGELQQWYFINSKNNTANDKIYHRYFYENTWSNWETGYLKPEDSGWKTLPLQTGVTVQNPAYFPCMYRKINNVVYVKGCVTGFAEVEKVIAVLPEGYRPAQSFYLQRATSAGKTNTYNIRTNGNIERIATTLEPQATSNYHFIDMQFLTD